MIRAPIFLETSPKVAVSTGQVTPCPALCDTATQSQLFSGRRRQIPPLSGRALEVLGHAIEYLADEFVLHSGSLPSLHADDPQVRAIQILMAANRSVYFECPLAPTLRERISRLLSRSVFAFWLSTHHENKGIWNKYKPSK
jgi:hypothetical protein